MRNTHSFRQLTPVTFLERCGRNFPDRVAVRISQRTVSFFELLQRSRWLAGLICNRNLRYGDRVAVISHNSLVAIDAHFGIPGAGCVIVAINPWLPEAEIEKQLRFAGVSLVIISHDLVPKLAAMLHKLVNEENIFIFEQEEKNSDYRLAYCSFGGEVLTGQSVSALEDAVVDENDPIAINFTSGTTGDPKGVMYSHRAAYLHALGLIIMVGLSRRSVYFWSLPIFHVNGWGFMWAAAAVGARQELRADIRTFDSKSLGAAVLESGATHLAGAPRLIRLLLEHENASREFSGLTILAGGASPTPDLVGKMLNAGIELIHQYGLNECLGPFVVCEPQESWGFLDERLMVEKRLRQGIASVHAGTGLRVVDSQGDDIPWDGKALGEIIMSGNTVALGYFNNPKATGAAFHDGWFHTGDLAVVHPDGYLEIKDREKDLIHIETAYGWENISSIEIENVISCFEGIRDVSVVGMYGKSENAKIVAFIEAESGFFNEASLRLHCQAQLPQFKVPSQFIETRLPKTATGKIRKNELEKAWANKLLTA